MSEQQKVSLKKLLLNLLAIAVLSLSIILAFFYLVLPTITDHGESITVPDLKGMHIDELERFLEDRDLSYRVTQDSGYSPDYKPLSVLKQFPIPYSKVKEKRKIYVTLNSAKPPNVKMPKITGTSVKSAQMVLNTLDLKIGNIEYVRDLAANNILKQVYDGKVIEPGTLIAKGSKIDLEVGDGFGNQSFAIDNFKDLTLEDTKFAIMAQGLVVGNIYFEESQVDNDKVIKQSPEEGTIMKVGQKIDLWVAKKTPESKE